MTLKQLKDLYNRFSNLPLPREAWDTPEYELYIDALHDNTEFYQWTLTEKFKKADFDYSEFCCLHMADKIFKSTDDNGELDIGNVDVVMRKWHDGTYGIPIHDGGSSIIAIDYCPWCGTDLKETSN